MPPFLRYIELPAEHHATARETLHAARFDAFFRIMSMPFMSPSSRAVLQVITEILYESIALSR